MDFAVSGDAIVGTRSLRNGATAVFVAAIGDDFTLHHAWDVHLADAEDGSSGVPGMVSQLLVDLDESRATSRLSKSDHDASLLASLRELLLRP